MTQFKSKKSGMIDTSDKKVTKRVARATAQITMGKAAFQSLISGQSPKGNVLEAARIAGIMAAKLTPKLIPMCHPLELNKIGINFILDPKNNQVTVHCEVFCLGRTGVEMEALTACSVAALTIYDMMKWADKSMVISNIKLLYKSGGKSGIFIREK